MSQRRPLAQKAGREVACYRAYMPADLAYVGEGLWRAKRTLSLSLALLRGGRGDSSREPSRSTPLGAWQRAGYQGHRLGQTWQGRGVVHILVDAPGVNWGISIPSLSRVYFRPVLLSLTGRQAGQPHHSRISALSQASRVPQHL